MSTMLTTGPSPARPHRPRSAEREAVLRARLHEEREFRRQQLAALEDETAPSHRHEGVRRALRIAASSALAEVDAALERMAGGRYGACVHCGQGIPDARLDVLPMVALCMPCHYNEQNCLIAASAAGGDDVPGAGLRPH